MYYLDMSVENSKKLFKKRDTELRAGSIAKTDFVTLVPLK